MNTMGEVYINLTLRQGGPRCWKQHPKLRQQTLGTQLSRRGYQLTTWARLQATNYAAVEPLYHEVQPRAANCWVMNILMWLRPGTS